MKNSEIKIIVASHKPYWIPQDPMYLPIQVGAAASGGQLIPGFQPDSDGENISLKNPNYCELTALFWAWKNLDADYIGLVHYRRYFKGSGERGIATEYDLGFKLNKNTVLVPSRRNYYIESVYDHYIHAHHKEPLDLALKIIKNNPWHTLRHVMRS